MSGSISAFNSVYASSTASMTSSSKLTDFTKSQLETLGIDSSSIKTEAQGIYALLTVKKAKASKKTQPPQQAKPVEANDKEEAAKSQAQITNGMIVPVQGTDHALFL